jgi:monofunctional chorismate mutase
MNKLEEARVVIDEIDQKMADLFKARMVAVTDVLDFKKENHLPVLDVSRETKMIEKNVSRFESLELRPYYEQFLKSILEISRTYQEDHYE